MDGELRATLTQVHMASLKTFQPILALLLCMMQGCSNPAGVLKEEGALKREIAQLEGLLYADSPDLEAEQHEWEARMAPEHSTLVVPSEIREILALEPTERSEDQRRTVKRYFRDEAESLAGVRKVLVERRAQLKAITRGRPGANPAN